MLSFEKKVKDLEEVNFCVSEKFKVGVFLIFGFFYKINMSLLFFGLDVYCLNVIIF